MFSLKKCAPSQRQAARKEPSTFVTTFFATVWLIAVAPVHSERIPAGWRTITPQQAEDLLYIQERTHHGFTHELDLTDERQYRYLLHMLALSGDSPKKSPELYRRLKAVHEGGGKQVTVSGGSDEGLLSLDSAFATANTGELVPLNVFDYFGIPKSAEPNTYKATALSSYPGGTTITRLSINLFYEKKGSGATQLAKNHATSTTHLQGENMRISGQGQLPASAASHEVTAHFQAIVVPLSGNAAPIVRAGTRTLSYTATKACLEEPIYKKYQTPPPPPPPHLSLSHQSTPQPPPPPSRNCLHDVAPPPKTECEAANFPPDKTCPLVMCWYRSSHSDCDYWQPEANPTSYEFPIKGTATFDKKVSSVDSVLLFLQRSAGGGCMICGSSNKKLCPEGSGSITTKDVKGEGTSTIKWNWPKAGFPTTADCMIPRGGDLTEFNLVISAIIGEGEYSAVQWASESSSPDVLQVPYVDVLHGCLAAGTRITLHDGSVRRVEGFEGGRMEHVRTSERGDTRPVLGNTRGTEQFPMVRARTETGHTLLMTEGHPVIVLRWTDGEKETRREVEAARDLAVGDTVVTESGPEQLVMVGREAYDDRVWNLKLDGTIDDVAEGKTTFFANGILVGDTRMQRHLAEKERERRAARTPEEILRDLPEAWREDYRNYLEESRTEKEP